MRVSDFRYELPEALIAQAPLAHRRDSRLLELDGASGAVRDLRFPDLVGLLREGDVLVVNDTRVLAARLAARKRTGGRLEVLLERRLDAGRLLAQVRASHPPRPGTEVEFDGGAIGTVVGRHGPFFEIALEDGVGVDALLERAGSVPLPPYIRRAPDERDRDRYQTVFARRPGAVAAPTAGLHFDEALVDEIRARGVDVATVTLHVGAGTFQPMRVEAIEDHEMHAEHVRVDEATCERIERARGRGGRVVAVGTTVVRALESAAARGTLVPFDGETRLFVRAGHRFRCVDALVTNFHLPESTLLVLVCAFAGREAVLGAYRHAVEQGYRFFSYGDAMFVTRGAGA